ncbi:hypothetical protein LT330_010205 [Penicillium expansum]|uniref:cellulase n=1 Tax=Penicillium expansum TaxID=27334 RepID=A0A0A2JSU0_PENEN|nr:Glycoside hydrolase, superfamily [Penicillium expansum]KAK4863995.1 hypothetical protein LT330_010205 [Penicillium expansum]KGO39860.1 Glycoside hydrolase, superfamily [Penicillium expansum]KGO41970.1 Glycoside hydrolase, superfamily [Penicillium expansum]KGO55285.1 Glycoside hydrolase, superfamily [Penicillium expansum]
MRYTSLLTIAGITGLVLAAPGPSLSKRASSFVWFGANEAGAEFGSGNIPGELGTDYIWPSTSTIQTLRNAGMNIFRIPFAMERLVPGTLTSSADATYLASLKSTVNYITSNGGYAVVDPHNFGRYDFAAFWTTLASEFASNNKVIFDTNNEFNSEDQTLVLNLNQAAINAIRAAGARSQYIFVEGNSWSGAWTWTTVNDNMKALTDPQDLIIYEMHQYLDSDGSGTSETCVSSTIGQERVVAATQWLKDNGKKAFLGEFAGGANFVCQSAVTGMLDYLQANSDVWLGASWWSAGPWWGDYMYSFEPPSGVGYTYYMSLLKKYFPGSSGSGGTTAAVTTTISATTSTTTTATTTTTTTTGSSTTGAAHYAQCGGKNWTGATICASPYTCQKQSDYYSQCL